MVDYPLHSRIHLNRLSQETGPPLLDVMKADDKNDHVAADIICEECKSILVTLHAPSASRPVVSAKKAAKASEMAAQEIDRLIDPSAPDEERQRRKRRLLKGPKESGLSFFDPQTETREATIPRRSRRQSP
jgi:hypothetical protein